MSLSVSISREVTEVNMDPYDYPVIAFPCPEKKTALIMAGKFQTLKELWSGRVRGAAGTDSSPPLILQTQQINI